ncbi:MAG: bis(5'-nucleosyl)-tetraphosphatase (symmetrical) YqeK [Clostridia bacterium]|nr:bis(5'-nucleosyl)-tetraphosphatase (symmetrical) YqeK [Clostridia bacterium]
MDWAVIEDKLRKTLKPERFRHTLGVVEEALELARRYGADLGEARLAALLHDCARGIKGEALMELIYHYGIPLTEEDKVIPDILHGQVGARLASEVYGVNSRNVLQAIERHTVGHRSMSLLDKIIFLADMIEPGRVFPGVDKLRKLAEEDLDKAVLAGFDSTIAYVVHRQGYLHPAAIEARNALWLAVHHRSNGKS